MIQINQENQDCQEKYQQTQICRWHHPYGRKRRGTRKPLGENERGEWKSCLKAQYTLHTSLKIVFNMSIHQAPGIMPCPKKKKKAVLSTVPNSQMILLNAFQIWG